MTPEFALIERYFTRPARRALLGVGDDCALVAAPPGEALAITTDMLVEGTHFLPEADPRLLAKFDGPNGLGRWRLTEGRYRVGLGRSAGDLVLTAEAPLKGRVFGS